MSEFGEGKQILKMAHLSVSSCREMIFKTMKIRQSHLCNKSKGMEHRHYISLTFILLYQIENIHV